MISVVLKKTHTHAGKLMDAGVTIEVDDNSAHWLERHNIAEPVVKELSRKAKTTDNRADAPEEKA